MVSEFCISTSRTVDDIWEESNKYERHERLRKYALSLSFKPLLADLIAFRECETFFFGTASRNGGKSSHNERNAGNARIGEAHEIYGRKVGINASE